MSAVMSNDERYEQSMAKAKERAARAQANVSISTSVPSVIEAISFQSFAAATTPKQAVQVPDEVVDGNPLPTLDAQVAALQGMGLIGLKTRADDIYLIVATACKNGADDLTGREIQALYERRYGRRIESGTISARVSELLAAQRILRRAQTRLCTVTRKVAAPVYVVMKQTRMVY